MTVQEIMERVGDTRTGFIIAYIKDGLLEMTKDSEQFVDVERIDITKDQRFYEVPKDAVQVLNIRCKNHLNNRDEYGSIPRMIGEPAIADPDET
tara:strand:+ start:855 stop:1136 length:282 start_codon:yes stop_codon:yes gene_type:complete